MFRVDFKPDLQEWAGAIEPLLLLHASRAAEINFNFDRVIDIRVGDVNLSPNDHVPVFGFISEIGEGLEGLAKGDTHDFLDVDGFPMEIERERDQICLTTQSWSAVPHGSQESDEEGLFTIGRACVPIPEFKAGMLDLINRFRQHLIEIYEEARGNARLESLIETYKRLFQETSK